MRKNAGQSSLRTSFQCNSAVSLFFFCFLWISYVIECTFSTANVVLFISFGTKLRILYFQACFKSSLIMSKNADLNGYALHQNIYDLCAQNFENTLWNFRE